MGTGGFEYGLKLSPGANDHQHERVGCDCDGK